jgi:hypothetical protein
MGFVLLYAPARINAFLIHFLLLLFSLGARERERERERGGFIGLRKGKVSQIQVS